MTDRILEFFQDFVAATEQDGTCYAQGKRRAISLTPWLQPGDQQLAQERNRFERFFVCVEAK
jgi:hypothetical protein